jgi:c(7)-type cytochrome triheme protein
MGRFFRFLFIIFLSATAAISCNPKTKAKSPLEAVMEATRTIPSPVPAIAPPLPGPSEQTPKDEIPEEVIEALAEILLESEGEEPHPLPFYFLPQNERGDVDWVAAVELGVIDPMDDLDPQKITLPPMDFDVVFKVKGDLPDVVYPHYPHTLWMDCKNCHPSIFVMRAGVNPVTMDAIAKGEFCGRCHGKVAFPLSDCNRCHSKPKPGKPFIIPKAPG